MAQTKTRKTSKPKAKSAPKAKRAAPKRKAGTAKASAPGKSAKPGSSNGSSRGRTSSNGHSSAAHKVVLPLVAGGAALAGTVGGVMLGASRSGGKVLGVRLPHPKRVQFKVDSGDLAKAGRQLGRFGDNVGELSAELRRARQGLAGDNKHSSPIEVLLRGLTTRR